MKPYHDPHITPGEIADHLGSTRSLTICKPMEITISQREKRYESKDACFTLTVSDGQQRVSVNISRHEAYRTIDAHGLTAYDERDFDSLTENRWDNTPPTEDTTTQTPL